MSKDKTGGLKGNLEWGSKARKEEDRLRGRNNRARAQTIAEQALEVWESRYGQIVTCPYCHGTRNDGRGTECGFCDDKGKHVLGT